MHGKLTSWKPSNSESVVSKRQSCPSPPLSYLASSASAPSSRNSSIVISWSPSTIDTGLLQTVSTAKDSQLLLQYYLEDGAGKLSPRTIESNPFITHVLPRAVCDETLMSAVLALGGAFLEVKYDRSNSVLHTAWEHYSKVLYDLRHIIQSLASHTVEQSVRVLLILIILAHIEAISGKTCGAIFSHLRPSRQLMLDLLANGKHNDMIRGKGVESFILEHYAYLALIAHITPYALDQARTIPLDPDLLSLDSIHEYDNFGTILSCGVSLFEKIPLVSVLARRRLCEEEQTGGCSWETFSTYQSLLEDILNWTSGPPGSQMKEYETAQRLAGEVYRHALLIYLKVSMCGAVVSNSPEVLVEIQELIDAVWDLYAAVVDSPFGTAMLWPTVIIGSCLTRETQRERLRAVATCPRWHMRVTEACINMLKLLWTDPDPRAFGPYGLHFIMKKHKINFCMV
ncbi:uncharacterized protein PV07_02027 [Cladophialophora immunda]|uniref:Fungal-specific transcription factor domain-containing protein n=1 Tax=Cladophialophora immunda TaxID=569365 RepID=A0A0D2CZB6_9EURO|nr:uncharacterized protein PV07_02027 [Cladophialophora immunda]KIW35325.1 hypothetical protein PV07_02027 [Cladophialophora immunda]